MGVGDRVGPPAYATPTPIRPGHRLDGFDCGKPPLDDWLKARALGNEGVASRTFVVADDRLRVLAYYTLATGAVMRTEVPRPYRQGLPDPVPVMVLGRLAVDRRHGGHGLGAGLLREALARTLSVSGQAGVRALIVHAIDDEAIGFYARYGFRVFPPGTRTLFLPIETIARATRG